MTTPDMVESCLFDEIEPGDRASLTHRLGEKRWPHWPDWRGKWTPRMWMQR